MRCESARKHLYLLSKLDFEEIVYPVQAEITEAKAHLSTCVACREFFAAEERLKVFLRTRAPQEKTPVALREKLLARLAQQRSSKLSRWFRISHQSLVLAILGGLALLLIIGGLWFNQRRTNDVPQQLVSIFVEDHTKNLPDTAQITSSDHNAVQEWFQSRVDFAFNLPPVKDPSLVGGRLCHLEGKRAALIFYQYPRNRVSLFIFDGGDFDLPKEHVIKLDDMQCLVDAKNGYTVVLWKERGLLYSLVSDISSTDLLQFAGKFQ